MHRHLSLLNGTCESTIIHATTSSQFANVSVLQYSSGYSLETERSATCRHDLTPILSLGFADRRDWRSRCPFSCAGPGSKCLLTACQKRSKPKTEGVRKNSKKWSR